MVHGKGKGIPPGRSRCVKCNKMRNHKTGFDFYKSRYTADGYRARNTSTCRYCIRIQNKLLYNLHKKFGLFKHENGTIKKIETNYVLGFFGLIMQLGPILNWKFNLDKNSLFLSLQGLIKNES